MATPRKPKAATRRTRRKTRSQDEKDAPAQDAADQNEPAPAALPSDETGPDTLSATVLAGLVGVSVPTIRRFFHEPGRLSARMQARVQAVLKDIGFVHDAPAPTPAPAPSAELPAAHAPPATIARPTQAVDDKAPLPAPAPLPEPHDIYDLHLDQEQGSDALDDEPLTINEIARLASVSTKTISRYLNNSPLLSDAMRARVERVIAETGFVPNAQARALALRRNFLFALVHDGSDPGIAQAVEAGMLGALHASDYALVLHVLDPARCDPLAALGDFLARHRPAGIVLLPPLSENAQIAAACQKTGTALMRLGPSRERGKDAHAPMQGLSSNDRAAMAQLVTWLVEQGHSRIGLVGGPESSLCAQERELGYLDAMADHGLDRGPALIEAGDYSFASGIAAGHLLLEISPRPSAIIACNDAMAAGLLHAAGEYRLTVPDDLSIIGFDDTAIATMTWPPLTSMHVPWHAMGAEAVNRLRRTLENPSAAQDRDDAQASATFEVRRIERGSVRSRALPAASMASGKSVQSGPGTDSAAAVLPSPPS